MTGTPRIQKGSEAGTISDLVGWNQNSPSIRKQSGHFQGSPPKCPKSTHGWQDHHAQKTSVFVMHPVSTLTEPCPPFARRSVELSGARSSPGFFFKQMLRAFERQAAAREVSHHRGGVRTPRFTSPDPLRPAAPPESLPTPPKASPQRVVTLPSASESLWTCFLMVDGTCWGRPRVETRPRCSRLAWTAGCSRPSAVAAAGPQPSNSANDSPAAWAAFRTTWWKPSLKTETFRMLPQTTNNTMQTTYRLLCKGSLSCHIGFSNPLLLCSLLVWVSQESFAPARAAKAAPPPGTVPGRFVGHPSFHRLSIQLHLSGFLYPDARIRTFRSVGGPEPKPIPVLREHQSSCGFGASG